MKIPDYLLHRMGDAYRNLCYLQRNDVLVIQNKVVTFENFLLRIMEMRGLTA